MCVIIINKSGEVPHHILERASWYNPDGAGMMWHSSGLRIYKNLNNLKVIEKYYELRRTFSGLIVLHFRVATHGKINFTNTQPIKVGRDTAIVHNGVITGYGNSRLSDTYMFAKTIDVTRLNNATYIEYLEKVIHYNRMVIMHKNGITILNKELFYNLGGNLYSNLNFLNISNIWNEYYWNMVSNI